MSRQFSVPLGYAKKFPQLAHALGSTTTLLDKLPRGVEASSRGHFEFEGRLGKIKHTDDGREKFIPGVSKAFMDATLTRVSKFPAWASVSPWTESQHCYYDLPPAPDDINGRGITVRTTTEFVPGELGDPATCRKKHISKHMLDKCDFSFKPYDTIPAASQYDLRIALSYEEPVPEKDLPVIVHSPTFVRINTRKTFLYKPRNASVPLWSMDFTMSWSGKTYEEAEEKQRLGTEDVTNYEIEVECRNPYHYLNDLNNDQITLALSLLMKMEDFVGKNLPFQWIPSSTRRGTPHTPYRRYL